LAQKAGCPKKFLNEIHGSWFDKNNFVVEMGKLLKHENFEILTLWRDLADLVISVGTSMVGMHSDTIVKEAIYKNKLYIGTHRSNRARNQCQGVVILNYQQTQYTLSSSLNIFNDINDTFLRLAK
jgi:NAD-dependent SIR2 family protein deacetylase